MPPALDPPQRLAQLGPLVRHIARLAAYQIMLEHALHVARVAVFHQEAREMRAADEIGVST